MVAALAADRGRTMTERATRLRQHRPTPQVAIEAIMYAVRERGLGALSESANIERLTRCDDAARAQINERIARLIAKQEIAA
jgi:hypothetical protein